jgi:hypothetical protein
MTATITTTDIPVGDYSLHVSTAGDPSAEPLLSCTAPARV